MSNPYEIWTFTYDANGMRASRSDGTTTYEYVYNGDQLQEMRFGNKTLYFSYDANGVPQTVTYNNTVYQYVTNQQGDIISIQDYNGGVYAIYSYNAWGELISDCSTHPESIEFLNPLRYRGYVYDQETGLYYLQSRYYNPETGRFLNADGYVSTGQGILGNNMFAYCGNNPVRNADGTGMAWYDTLWGWINTITGTLNPTSKFSAVGSLAVAVMQGRWSDIQSDWKNGCFNLFNQSEDVALKSKVLGFYKGSTVVRQDVIGTSSFFGTVWAESRTDETILKHEYGHSVQERILGSQFITTVGIPSVAYYWYDYLTDGKAIDYYSTPWERTADWLGGVNRTCGYKSGSLAWGIVENILGPVVIPFYMLYGY